MMPVRKHKWATIGFLIILCSILFRSVTLAQEVDDWSEPMQISAQGHPEEVNWFPDIAVDRQGRLHVVWDSNIPPRTIDDARLALTMYAVRDLDEIWSTPNDIAIGRGTELSRPAIVSDPAGLLHMAFRPSGRVYYTQADTEDAASAQAWQLLHRLSGNGANYTPDIAVDSKGVIHVVWSEQVPLALSEEVIFRDWRYPQISDIFYRRSEDGGATWTPPLNLSRTSNVASGRVQIKVDNQDIVHVAWDEGWDRNAPTGFGSPSPICGMYIRSQDGGQTWSAPKVIDSPRIEEIHPSDTYYSYEAGLRQLLDRMSRESHRYSEALVYARLLMENVSEAREVQENVNDAERLETELVALKVERTDIITPLNELALSVLGISFDELSDLSMLNDEQEALYSLPQGDNAQITLGVNDDEGVLLVWYSRESRHLYYAWSEDGGVNWSDSQRILGIYARPWSHAFDRYDAATDSLGHIHVVLVATTISPEVDQDPSLGLYHLSWNGEDWSEPRLIANYPKPSVPENPKITTSRGNRLHVVWYVRPDGDWERNTQIWYSELEIDAPTQEPVPSPTPTATPTLTPTPVPLPTATPLPTLGPDDSSVPEGLYTENDDLIRLTLALSPVTVILLTIAVLRFGPSRRRE